MLHEWRKDCKDRSNKHEVKGKKNKIKFALFGIPSIMIPVILGGVSSIVPCHSLVYTLGMMMTGLFGGIGMFFNFGKKEQSHFEYMNKFFELANEIEAELSKPKRMRIAWMFIWKKLNRSMESTALNLPLCNYHNHMMVFTMIHNN